MLPLFVSSFFFVVVVNNDGQNGSLFISILLHNSELWRGSGGAMVLGKLPVPGRSTNLGYSRARAYCACSRCGLGGAMVLGKLPVMGRSTNLGYSRARAYCACSRCGWGLFGLFLSSIISSFFLPLSGKRPDID